MEIVQPSTRRLKEEYSALCTKTRAFRHALPAWLFAYLCLVYLVLSVLVWWMPVCDFDSMTSYLARIALERVGPLRQTATLEIQYSFPKFFDYLHAPLLKWGWFTTLPSFALFSLTVLLIIRRLPTAIAVTIVLGLTACSPVLVHITSPKNDLALALMGLLSWLWIYQAKPTTAWYPAVGLLLAAAMVGTKWHGIVLATIFLGLMSLEIIKARRVYLRAASLVLCVLPLAWYLSSAAVYLENHRIDGAYCPVPAYLREQVSVSRNIFAFTANSLLETFEIPIYLADTCLDGQIWKWWHSATWGSKAYSYAITPTTHISVYGVAILAVIACSLLALCLRRTPWPVRASALVSVTYCAFLFCSFRYSTWINRYFLTTYVLGLVPCAYLAQFVAVPRKVKWGLYAYVLFVSLHSVLLNQERLLLPIEKYVARDRRWDSLRPLYRDLYDRASLQFHMWPECRSPYRTLRENLRVDEQLLIVNCHGGNDCPFILPFLKERTAQNTEIVNLRFGQTVPPDLAKRFDYVLVFRGRRSDGGFVPVYEDGNVAIYRNARLSAGTDRVGLRR